ncbi:MAG: peptide ABC transporter substrate-binding protein [Myxococcota bacterium]
MRSRGASIPACLSLGLSVLTLLSACKKPEAAATANTAASVVTPANAGPRRVTIATSQEPDTLLSMFAEVGAAQQVIEAGVRWLTYFDREWKLQPGLAVEIPTLQNGGVVLLDGSGAVVKDVASARKMRVTWKLHPEARWADGTPVTAHDFIFAHEVLADPTQEVRDRTVVEKVEKLEAQDEKTLVVHWKEPYAFYLAYRNHPALPRHALEKAYRVDGGRTLSLKKSEFGRAPLLYGPFMFQEWKPGEYIRLVRNPHAHLKPVVDEVIWRFVPKDSSAVAMLETGAVDAISPDGTVTPDAALELLQRRPNDFVVDFQPGMVWAHVDVNVENAWLQDKRVRQALLHALDRQGAINAVFKGRYLVSHGLFPDRHPGHHAALKQFAFDAARADVLLTEAGWKKGPDGIRVNGKGERLVLELVYATGQKSTDDLLQIFQSNLKNVGVELKLLGSPPKVFFGETLKHRKSQHLAFYAWVTDPFGYAETILPSHQIPSEKNSWQGTNYMGYRNTEADKLVAEIPRELDAEARAAKQRRLNDLFVDELPILPIYTRPVVSIARKGFQNWAPTGTQTTVSWNAERWSLQ